jgi:O-methyltransferase
MRNRTELTCLEVGWPVEERAKPSIGSKSCMVNFSASPELTFMENVLLGLPTGGRCDGGEGGCHLSQIKPYEENLRRYGNDWPPSGYTMIGRVRLQNFRCAIEEVNWNRVPGDIVELGVWRGGAMIMAALVMRNSKVRRRIVLFDALGNLDIYDDIKSFLKVSEPEVREAFRTFGVGVTDHNVHLVPGLFKNTLPTWRQEMSRIAVLRIDGNFYDSYQDAMYWLYEKVPIGGIVIFDDIFSHAAVMEFWNDFKAEQQLPEDLVRIDMHSSWFRKEKEIVMDWNFFRKPRDVNKV